MYLFIPVLLVLLLMLGGAYYAYRIAFYSPMRDRDKLPSTSNPAFDPYRAEMKQMFQELQQRPFAFVTVQSRDGLILSGRYYHVMDGAPLDICFHGYRSSPMTDFSGGSRLSLKMGHNLLLVDQRAHGKSQGRTIAFGLKERYDLLDWVNYAIDRFGPEQKILLYGISMGGATVLMAAELELPANVKGIIADCPYASPIEIILHVGKKMPIPNWLIRPFARWGAWIFGGFQLEETDASQTIRKARIPFLILHGEADQFVPMEMSALTSENPALVTRFTFPGAGHGMSYLKDPVRYEKIVRDFTKRVLH